MPSIDHCVTKPSEMTTLTNSLEVFDTYKHREDKDSDEESFHLPLDDDESESKFQDPIKNGSDTHDTEQEILNGLDAGNNDSGGSIDADLEERLLNDDEGKDADQNGIEENSDTQLKTNSWTNSEDGASKKSSEDVPKENGTDVENDRTVEDKTSIKDDRAIEYETSNAQLDESVNNQLIRSENESEQIETKGQLEDQSNESEKQTDAKTEERGENSNDSSKAQNEDSEDLFDISIIRDAEEDNADRRNEENHAEENEDYEERNDEKVDENGKATSLEEEEEEMDVDKQEDPSKNDEVDIEEGSLNCDGGKDASDGESDNGNKTELLVQNNEQQTSNVENSVNSEENSMAAASEEKLDDKENVPLVEDEEKMEEADKSGEDPQKKKTLKRVLAEEEKETTNETKRSRTDQGDNVEMKENEQSKEKPPLKKLLSFSEFMKNKKINAKRLTVHDLEEFCLQKICEVIVHKSDLGDVHYQMKVQEQTIEAMRKEITQLSKQSRDLEIVNKKLMNDLKQQSQKPLSPLKITRSVGLQVKFTALDPNAKRRQGFATQKTLQPTSKTSRGSGGVAPSTPNRQQATPPQKSQHLPTPNTPLLSQALTSRRNNTDSTPKTPSPAVRVKQSEPKHAAPSSSVIDLTDEDDKRDKAKTTTTTTTTKMIPIRAAPGMRVNSTNSAGIRLGTTQSKGSPITSVVTSTAPQLMYVVQSSPQNGLASSLGTKAVVVNFQPTNGVLASTLNGSAVSVIPKQGNTVQMKPVAATSKSLSTIKAKPLKHPAALPTPPVARVVSDKPLKPIPPKPHLSIRKTDTGIILQWKMPYELEMYEVIASYQLYAYQETSATPSTDMWRKVGDVKALALPMACTLTQFADKNKYYFAVRPVDIHKRIGMFSDPEEISL